MKLKDLLRVTYFSEKHVHIYSEISRLMVTHYVKHYLCICDDELMKKCEMILNSEILEINDYQLSIKIYLK